MTDTGSYVPASGGEPEKVFAAAADLFAVLSTPVRLKIMSALCDGPKNVSQLLAEIETTQPNLSQHLATLYRAGILGRRREGPQVFYSIQSERAAALCRAVCTHIAGELDGSAPVDERDRLVPVHRRT